MHTPLLCRAMQRAVHAPQVLGGLLAAASLVAVRPAAAIDVFDDRKVRDNGFDLIYEARDLDLPQATRDGFTQARHYPNPTLPRDPAHTRASPVHSLVACLARCGHRGAAGISGHVRASSASVPYDLFAIALICRNTAACQSRQSTAQ